MNSTDLLTVTGKPLTIGTGLRLPVTIYQQAKERAQRENRTVNKLFCELIAKGLDSDQDREAKADD